MERELVIRAQRGDREAFSALVMRFWTGAESGIAGLDEVLSGLRFLD